MNDIADRKYLMYKILWNSMKNGTEISLSEKQKKKANNCPHLKNFHQQLIIEIYIAE